MTMTRRHLIGLGAAGLALQACGLGGRAEFSDSPRAAAPDDLDRIADQILSGGPPPDGIPPIEKPQYVSAAEAAKQWKDDAIVEGVIIDGQPRAYPRFITVWHEIVNETIGGAPVTITYCPLTGSAVVFSGQLADGRTTDFGTSGSLYNSNLVMYDRATRSLWPQILGVAVKGERKGERLRELPLAVTTTWGRWRAKHPQTLVLSKDTGHARLYGTWPYGDYDTAEGIMFPITATDERFKQKKVVVGVRAGGQPLAIPKDEFSKRRVANVELGGIPVVVLYDDELDAIRVFRRSTSAGELRFSERDRGFVDEQTGSRWAPEGRATDGKLSGSVLEGISAYNVMWFAWYAFNPGTEVLR